MIILCLAVNIFLNRADNNNIRALNRKLFKIESILILIFQIKGQAKREMAKHIGKNKK